MAKTGHFCFLHNTPTPRRRAPPRRRSLRLGRPETPFEKFLLHLGEHLRLGVALVRLGQATIPVLFFLRLILESITLLFELSMEDN